MKKFFANKKIQVAALAVICIGIAIAVLSLNEKRKEELMEYFSFDGEGYLERFEEKYGIEYTGGY